MPATEIRQADAPVDGMERCGCDCARWAHRASRICRLVVAAGELQRLHFEDDLNPTGPYPRRVCAPCAEHLVFAGHRGGERIAEPVTGVR